MKPILEIRNISKSFRINTTKERYLSLRDNVWKRFGQALLPQKKEIFWALKDVSFDVYPGDTIGIIGKNGAGKSTLLKILSRITPPTKGYIRVRGRIASLLEVGTGFHPELTGRENIFLNGSILGLKRLEIKDKFDEIVDFSGVEKFLDTPLKHYSSGMQLRLAFSVAAFLEPEILVVDEVLAVGDLEFQKKCMGKMEDVSNNEGRTILFVSHNFGMIKRLCKRGILLQKGEVLMTESSEKVISMYQSKYTSNSNGSWKNSSNKYNKVFLSCIEVLDESMEVRTNFLNSEVIYIRTKLISHVSLTNFTIALDIIKNNEVVLRTRQVDSLKIHTLKKDKFYEFICELPKWFFNVGTYSVRPYLSIHCVENLFDDLNAELTFLVDIDPTRSSFHMSLNNINHPGFIFPTLNWSINEKGI